MQCVFCDTEPVEDARYCHVCGGEVHDLNIADVLDIKIEKEDIESYIFRGYIEKTIKLKECLHIQLKTLSMDEFLDANKKADAIISEHGGMGQDTIVAIRNKFQIANMLVGISDKPSDFKKPAVIGKELMDLLVFKSQLLQRALNVALQSDKVSDF